MKAKDIKTTVEAISSLGIMGKVLPGPLALALTVNYKTLAGLYQSIETQRVAIIERYAQKDDEGKPVIKGANYQVPPDAQEQMVRELKDLLDTDLEVAVRKVAEDTLAEYDGETYDGLTPSEMQALLFMVE